MINFSFPFILEIPNTKPSTISLFAALGFVVIHLEYSGLTLCDLLSYVDNKSWKLVRTCMYVCTYVYYAHITIYMTVQSSYRIRQYCILPLILKACLGVNK